jgi:hypothetical protein
VNESSIEDWWTMMAGNSRKAITSLLMHLVSPAHLIITKIKEEARIWSTAGAKASSIVIPG